MRVTILALLLTTSSMLTCARAGDDDQAWRLVPAAQSPVAGLPKANALALADFNADGRPDLAAINGDPGHLLILMNESDGRFAPRDSQQQPMAIGETASGLVAADVNGDKLPDIVISHHDRDEVGVMLSKGDGTFEPLRSHRFMTRTRGAPHVHNLALAHLNNDGHLDLVVTQADDNAIVWAQGAGAGTGGFTPGHRALAAGEHPYTIVVADFNGDGHVDCAAPNANSDDLTIGLGDGAGRFAAPVGARTALPRQTLALAAGDVNGDRRIDLVGSSDDLQRTLILLLGDGTGGFTRAPQDFHAPARVYSQIVTDVDGDGVNDVIAPCIDRSSVFVWLAEDPAALRFRRLEFATPGVDSQVMAIGDVNGDGVNDIVTAGWQLSTIAVLLGAPFASTTQPVDRGR